VQQRPSQIPHVAARDGIESEDFAEKGQFSKAGPCSIFTVTRYYTRPQVFMADNMALSSVPHKMPVMIDTKTKQVYTNPYRQVVMALEIL